MALKCCLCKETIETIFLGKIHGTYVDKRVVCSACQRKHQDLLPEVVS